MEATTKKAVAERKTAETRISVTVEDSPRRDMSIDTGFFFLDHQMKQIAWRLCMNIDASVEARGYKSAHTTSEDLGIVLGKALLKMYKKRSEKEGASGFGYSRGIIDESTAWAAVSIEGRANSFIKVCPEIERLERVEDMLTADMYSFIEGLAQGMKATVQIEIKWGRDPHHAWEAAFRALGEALKNTLAKNEWRKGVIAGVKETLE